MMTTVVWLRRDLRLIDNPALYHAARRGPVIPLYILDEQEDMGGASCWWLHHSLRALQGQFQSFDCPLILRRGDALSILQELIRDSGADALYWNRLYEPRTIQRDREVKTTLQAEGLEVKTFNSSLLNEPWEVQTGQGGPYKVFTPYWRQAGGQITAKQTLPVRDLGSQDRETASDDLRDWALLPAKPDWSGGLAWRWTPGEKGALDRFDRFLEQRLQLYADKRDFPAVGAISGLSPHLHFGEISVRDIWNRLGHFEDVAGVETSVAKFRSELGWREFSSHLLYHFPEIPEKPFRSQFSVFPWQEDEALLTRWQQGRTGYPFVDAGMRELWQTGFMHNRVRMVVASFLTKNLLIPWQKGAEWFRDTLVDADLASNSASWQWVAGCGADAAPYFRIFNPVTQGQKFDPQGKYIRKWVPELRDLDGDEIHTPWKVAKERTGNYPDPVVDLSVSRERALAAYKSIK
ncbi:deoxyribodipyrimidine photo-lyase [Emcibacter sp.]|uniref:cryptochrome/photolyase family protein n=1 Tax=Emcibacter sp. TaxID=1979954 RepID=UPI002AA6A44D|nr:deoxyribodipyrimidine photo-lyase [Emcibacter sp.]